jgi:hypothetical protein
MSSRTARARRSAQLEVRGPEPGIRVVVAVGLPQLPPRRPLLRGGPGVVVGGGGVRPHPELDEDVRGHVPGVRGGGRDARVLARRGQRQHRVVWRVAGVDEVVRPARVVGLALEHVHGDGRGLHQPAGVPEALGVGHQGERVLQGQLVVRRKGPVRAVGFLEPGAVALLDVARAVQHPRGGEVGPLRRPERLLGLHPGERRPGRLDLLLAPDRVAVGHGVAPVRHRAARVRLRRGLEGLVRVVVLEGVQLEHPPHEEAPALGVSGDGKVQHAVARRGARRECDGQQQGGHRPHLRASSADVQWPG